VIIPANMYINKAAIAIIPAIIAIDKEIDPSSIWYDNDNMPEYY